MGFLFLWIKNLPCSFSNLTSVFLIWAALIAMVDLIIEFNLLAFEGGKKTLMGFKIFKFVHQPQIACEHLPFPSLRSRVNYFPFLHRKLFLDGDPYNQPNDERL